jgi:predicted Zn-dependent protease
LAAAFEKDPANYYKQSFNNESMLAAAYAANGLDKEAILWSQKAYRRYKNDPRMGYNYANELLKRKQHKEAYAIYEALIHNFPTYALSYPPLISYYYSENKYDDLYRVLNKMHVAYTANSQAFTSRIAQEQMDSYLTLWADLKKYYERK